MSTRISLSLLSKVENGWIHDPRISTVVKLSRAYKVDIASLARFFARPGHDDDGNAPF